MTLSEALVRRYRHIGTEADVEHTQLGGLTLRPRLAHINHCSESTPHRGRDASLGAHDRCAAEEVETIVDSATHLGLLRSQAGKATHVRA